MDYLGIVGKQVAEESGCDTVDKVPPGASHDELFEHSQRVRGEPFSVAWQSHEINGGVTFFAIFGFSPDRECGVMPGIRVIDWMSGENTFLQRFAAPAS